MVKGSNVIIVEWSKALNKLLYYFSDNSTPVIVTIYTSSSTKAEAVLLIIKYAIQIAVKIDTILFKSTHLLKTLQDK